ncbi:branched-chain amino acid ABC transporter permease [Sphaerisporangium rufum]|uniref:Branched-chain amino acid ABC transporter permease n=1 Tax=Sphaerisporangium rufum TaxID=1381558 RepID=A0A919QXW4_9ACTN|nr:branched-chain amino acid ABC transporter permease [Sphaerisporangium rufum]GII75992.1 branched-chain amino acid ABC transporter permease [Sphaerisporangium rufum]
MNLLLETLLNGLLIGGVYGIFSVGFALQFGTLRIINFTHGDFVMLAMFLGFFAVSQYGWNPFAVIPVAMVLFGLVGAVFFTTVFNRLKEEPHEIQLIATITLSAIITAGTQGLFGQDARSLDTITEIFQLGGVHLGVWKVIGLGISLLLAGGLWLLLTRSGIGRDIRASVDDAVAARLQGINTRRAYLVAFSLGALLAGAAGATLITFYPVTPSVGANLLVLAFAAVLVGGAGSLPGAFLGGLILAVVQQVTATYQSPALQNAYVFLLFLFILVVKPAGLFGRLARVD